jgi:hypothetical protein
MHGNLENDGHNPFEIAGPVFGFGQQEQKKKRRRGTERLLPEKRTLEKSCRT